MLNKKYGFTLIELLVVIVILSIVMVFSIPIITNSQNNTTEKVYESKKSNIEYAAILYAQDILHNNNTYTGEIITVSDLADKNYIIYDENSGSIKKVTDPRRKLDSLNHCTVTITIDTVTRKIAATFNEEDCE